MRTFESLFGTGQGRGASPSVWLTLVVVPMNTLDRIIPERMTFSSPTSPPQQHDRLINAFVDDTSLGFTDPGMLTLETNCSDLGKDTVLLWRHTRLIEVLLVHNVLGLEERTTESSTDRQHGSESHSGNSRINERTLHHQASTSQQSKPNPRSISSP